MSSSNSATRRVRSRGKAAETGAATRYNEDGSPVTRDERAEARRPGMSEDSKKARHPLPAREIAIPTDGMGGRVVMLADPNIKPTDRPPGDDAPPPPPGWRYNLVGKLVPLEESRVSLTTVRGKEMFLEVFEKTGSPRAALDAIGQTTTSGLEGAIASDPEFERAYDIALDRHRSRIYQAAHERAVDGYLVPIVGGAHKDEIVAYERRYSDRLMEMFLKRHFPDFRETGGPKVVVNTQQNNVAGLDPSKMTRVQREAYRKFLESMGPTDDAPAASGGPHAGAQLTIGSDS